MSTRRTGVHPGLLGGIVVFVASLVLCCGVAVCLGPSMFGFFDDDDRAAPGQEATPTWTIGDRHNRLAAPGRPRRYEMEFGDASTGYVLFMNCARPCPASLYGTTDGGRTWQSRPLDLDGADVVSLFVAGPTMVAVSGGGGTYRVSRDGGHTFVTEKDFPEEFKSPSRGKARLDCQEYDDDSCRRYAVARGGTPLPVQPPLPADRDKVDDVVEDATGRIWTVVTVRNMIYTAVSADGGASWRSLPDLDVGPRKGPVVLTAAPDDREPWLVVGYEEPGRVSAYRGASDRWRPVAERHPIDVEWHNAVSAGGGAVAVFGDGMRHLFDDGTWRTAAPTAVQEASLLADGSLQASSRDRQGVWLGTRAGSDFAWASVTVEPV